MVILALLAAFKRAPAAGHAVPRGVAWLVGAVGDAGVATRGHAAHKPCANHAEAPVPGRGGWLRLDVQVLMTGREVYIRVLTQVPVKQETT